MSDELSKILHAWAELATRQSMENNRKFIHEGGYSFAQMNSLFFIHHHEQKTINHLATHLGISKAAASQMIERLVDCGLVNRDEDPQDRRSKLLSLTEAGLGIIRESKRVRHAWIDDFCQSLDSAEAETITQALEVLVERMKAYKEKLTEKNTEK